MRLLLVTGGLSDERAVSLRSSSNVSRALQSLGINFDEFDLANGYESLKEVVPSYDLVFPVLHGEDGESGKLQRLLEEANINFVGSGSKACKISWDKVEFKKYCEEAGISTPRYKVVDFHDLSDTGFAYPFILKPTDNGSSIHLYLIRSEEDFSKVKNPEEKFVYMAEEYISGTEFTVGVLGNEVLPPIEIIPPNGELFDYENKYNGRTQEIPNAPSLTKSQKEEVMSLALKIHNEISCRHYSRIDFIFRDGSFFVLELNTIPGLTEQSLFPKAAMSVGLDFKGFVRKLINLAYE